MCKLLGPWSGLEQRWPVRDQWIRKTSEYQAVYREGIRIAGRWVILYCRSSASERARFGIAVTRRIGKAVTRNRIKRRIREILRRNFQGQEIGIQMVLVAKSAIRNASYQEIEEEILGLVQRSTGRGRSSPRDPGCRS